MQAGRWNLDTPLRQNLALTAMLLAAVILIPVLAVLAFVTRFFFAATAALLLVAALLAYLFSPAFRDWVEDGRGIEYNGLHLVRNIALHPSHTWARFDASSVAIGADDLALKALGPVEDCSLPRKGDWVRQGEALVRLRHGRHVLDLRSPVSGRVIEANDRLREDPKVANGDPYGEGWMVSLRPDSPKTERKGLLRGRSARAWFRREVDRFLTLLMPTPATGKALPDGGELVGDLYRLIDDVTWNRLRIELFS